MIDALSTHYRHVSTIAASNAPRRAHCALQRRQQHTGPRRCASRAPSNAPPALISAPNAHGSSPLSARPTRTESRRQQRAMLRAQPHCSSSPAARDAARQTCPAARHQRCQQRAQRAQQLAASGAPAAHPTCPAACQTRLRQLAANSVRCYAPNTPTPHRRRARHATEPAARRPATKHVARRAATEPAPPPSPLRATPSMLCR